MRRAHPVAVSLALLSVKITLYLASERDQIAQYHKQHPRFDANEPRE